jgi:hypothetical protein
MKKVLLTTVGLFVLILALSGICYGWQGRMGGMGDPFGLVADESDYLIHPAKIAKGEGVSFYGDYRFTYTGVTDWDSDYIAVLFDTSGQEYKHDALVGAAFPLGTGRMGLFFEYAGKRGDYDGIGSYFSLPFNGPYELTNKRDNFALRLLYGLPVDSFNLGGEVQFVYCQEENKTSWQAPLPPNIFLNYFGFGNSIVIPNIMPFMVPYDSNYWEALFKGSLDGKVGPLDLEFTLRGGLIFGGDNDFDYALVGNENFNLNGNVSGWRIGGDLWLRYPLANDLSLPFLVRIDYQEKTRDGDGSGAGGLFATDFVYEHKEKPFKIEVGGGIDKRLASSTRIAAGLYYNYLQGTNEIKLDRTGAVGYKYDSPASTEHRIVVRMAGEHELTPMVALRMGLNFFYSWVQADYNYFRPQIIPIIALDERTTLDGNRWGISASLGGTIRVNPFTLEPFIAGGYQSLALSGIQGISGISFNEREDTRNEWSIGGGLSVLYDL